MRFLWYSLFLSFLCPLQLIVLRLIACSYFDNVCLTAKNVNVTGNPLLGIFHCRFLRVTTQVILSSSKCSLVHCLFSMVEILKGVVRQGNNYLNAVVLRAT